MCPALTCMVEVMVGVEVAMVDMVVAWPGDITVGRGEATVLGISILLVVAATWSLRRGGLLLHTLLLRVVTGS